jgi:hypothetical protein
MVTWDVEFVRFPPWSHPVFHTVSVDALTGEEAKEKARSLLKSKVWSHFRTTKASENES